jgi:hypothetical protein
MKTGQVNVADVILKLYKPLCHQLAYRSFFLFGEQAVYPRELAGIEGLATYETATGLDGEDMAAASAFRVMSRSAIRQLYANEIWRFMRACCYLDWCSRSTVVN